MGRARRVSPNLLGEKLFTIRGQLDLPHEGLIEGLECPKIPLHPASISTYESGKREPPLPILLRYARLGKITMEALVEGSIELPKRK